MTLDFATLAEGPVGEREETKTEAEITLVSPANIEAVKNCLAEYTSKVDGMLAEAQRFEIETDEDEQQITVLLGDSKSLYKAIEKRRKEIIDEPNKFVKSCNNFCKTFTEKLKQTEKIIKEKIAFRRNQQEIARRKQEQEAQKAAQELQEKLDKEAANLGVESVKIDAPIIPEKEKIVRTDTGTTTYEKKTWKCDIVKPELVPREYCAPVQKLLNEAVKQGVREIAGCNIYEKTDIITRT